MSTPPPPVFAIGIGFSSLGNDVVKQAAPPVFAMGVGFSSLGRDVVKQANSLRELGNQVSVFVFSPPLFFFGGNHNGGRVDHVVRGGEPSLRARGMIAPRCVKMVKHPRGSYTVLTTVSGSESTRKKSNSYVAVIRTQGSKHKMPNTLSRMQRTLHATRRISHGASRLVM